MFLDDDASADGRSVDPLPSSSVSLGVRQGRPSVDETVFEGALQELSDDVLNIGVRYFQQLGSVRSTPVAGVVLSQLDMSVTD